MKCLLVVALFLIMAQASPNFNSTEVEEVKFNGKDLSLFIDAFYDEAFGMTVRCEDCVDEAQTAMKVIDDALYIIVDHDSII